MFWIVTKKLTKSEEELDNRYKYIENVSGVRPTLWIKCKYKSDRFPYHFVEYYKCNTKKGEHGFIITAHMNLEVQTILMNELTAKRAIVVLNSCYLKNTVINECCSIIKSKNEQSEILLAKQKFSPEGFGINYCENVGTFGFSTTVSERELFQHRREGLIKALRNSYYRIAN